MTLATALLSAFLAAAPEPAAQPATAAPSAAAPAPVTLVGAGALGSGGAAWLTEAGYPSIAVTYAQGIGAWDDLGATIGISWTTGEMVVGLVWRRELAGDEGSRAGFRLTAGPWFDFGSTWVWSENQANLGLLLAPGAAWTASVGAGLVSASLDLGFEWAMKRGMGVAFLPRLALAYEAPIAKDLTLGARAGLWVRWSSGSAAIPGMDARLLGELVALVTWRVF
jgi:hypothetical protein